MKSHLWLCLLLCVCFQAQAQLSDSLYRALPDTLRPKNKRAVTDQEKIRIIINSSPPFVYRFHNEIKPMALHLEKILESLKTNDAKMRYAHAIAGFHERAGNVSLDQYWYKKVIEYGEGRNINRRLLSEAYLNVAIIDAFQEKQDSAVNLLQKAAIIAISDKDSTTLRNTYYVYIPIYGNLHLYPQAIYNADKFLTTTPASEKWSTSYTEIMMTKANLYSRLYRDEKKPAYADSTKRLIQEVMEATKKEEAYWYKNCYISLGLLHYYLADYPKAIQYYDLASLPKHHKPGSYQAELDYKDKLYRHMALLQMGKAANIAELTALKIPPKDFAAWQEFNQVLSRYYTQQGDYKKALTHYTQYKLYADSLDLIGQRGKVFEAEQKYSVAQKEVTIKDLENKNLQAQITRNRIVVTGIIVLLVLAILALLFYLRTKRQQAQRVAERQKLTDELHRMEQEMELERLRQQADKEVAISSQRKTISQNMHDEVSSSLAALRYLIADVKQQAKSTETRQALIDIEDEAKTVYLQAREFMHGLHNSQVGQTYNVVDLLENLSLRFGGGSGLQVVVEADQDQIQTHFTPQQHAELYRIIKEAVANSMKHSGADRIKVRVYAKAGSFHVDIQDNGRGLHPNQGSGLGIAAMQQRMAALQGDLRINSTAQGLHINGHFPMVADQTTT